MEVDKTIITTRLPDESNEFEGMLKEAGFSVTQAPCISIVPTEESPEIDDMIRHLGDFTHVFFTSKNGASNFFALLKKHKVPLPPHVRFLAIGNHTAKAVRSHGYQAATFPSVRSSTDAVKTIDLSLFKQADTILFPRGNLADTLIESYFSTVCNTIGVEVYRTIRPANLDIRLEEIVLNGFDAVEFSSPSSVVNSLQNATFRRIIPNKNTFCIGQTTAAALRKAGIEPSLTSSNPQAGKFVEEMQLFYSTK